MEETRQSSFCQMLVSLNRLDRLGFKCWVFQPGMEFGTLGKWWEETGSRPTPHEGIDFCCFEDRESRLVDLDEKIKVPALYDGTVVKIFNDFLGSSILVSHKFQDKGRTLYSIYAHIVPVKTMKKGSQVREGRPIATICSTANKSIRPHLHLTVFWADESVVKDLDWQVICEKNLVILCNPMNFSEFDSQ